MIWRSALMDLKLGDKVELKKSHPCGCREWKVTRIGMDIKLCCCGCRHEIMFPRHKIEKSIKMVIREEKEDA